MYPVKSSGVFRTQVNIYDEASFSEQLIIFAKNYILDGLLGEEASENNEIFKMKARWKKLP